MVFKEAPIRYKVIALAFIFIIVFLFLFVSSRPDGRVHLVFCDVGQGDAIYIKTPTGDDVLVDGGPDSKVLNCLSDKMGFFDRTIEFLILTHPQADHMNGLIEVLRRYGVKEVMRAKAENKTPEYVSFASELENEQAKIYLAKKDQVIDFGGGLRGRIIWPEDPIFETDLNNTSIVLRLEYGQFCAILTGDATNSIWPKIATSGSLSSCSVLKIAHHGSKNGTDNFLLSQIAPKIAVVSAGKNNRFGHPHQEVTELLEKKQIKVLRTDLDGKIEITSGGGEVVIKTDKM